MTGKPMPARPVLVGLTRDLDAQQVDAARQVVLDVLVPQMRAQFAADLARQGLRPLDGWPAVQVTRYVWTSQPEYVAAMMDGKRPAGMRELTAEEREAGCDPDLYRLELSTRAVPDTQVVEL